MNRYNKEVHSYWCNTIITEGELNEWEDNFINTVKYLLDHDLPLTDNQEGQLERLYGRVTK